MVVLDHRGLASTGTERAILHARALGRPVHVVALDKDGAAKDATAWLKAREGEIGENTLAVCIAGPRESEAPGIYREARDLLPRLFKGL
jgi:hypothetical protein